MDKIIVFGLKYILKWLEKFRQVFGSFHFHNFVFSYFGHFRCVIFFKFFPFYISVLPIALLSKKVNKHDYVIFWYFRNFSFVSQNKKLKMEWKAHYYLDCDNPSDLRITWCSSKSARNQPIFYLKFGPSEKGTKFEKIFSLKFDATE